MTALPRPWQRPLLWLGRVILGLIALVFVIWLVLYITKGRFLRQSFEQIASSQLNRPVKVAGEFNLYFAPINIAFRADGLSITNPYWAKQRQFLNARHIALRLETFPLLFGKRHITTMDADGTAIHAEWDALRKHNSWTFGEPNARPKPFEMPDIASGFITNSTFTYNDPLMRLSADVAIQPLVARNSAIRNALGFAGTGSLQGKTIRFSGRIDQADQALLHAGSSSVSLHGEGAATTLDLQGHMPGLTTFAAGRYSLAVRGANMANLFDLIGVAVVPTRRYHLRADLARDGEDWSFTGIKGRFGDSDLAGKLAVGFRDTRLHLDADLKTASLDLLDAAPFVGFDPARLDKMGAKGLITKVAGHPRILPDAPLRSDAINRFDADVRYRVAEISTKNFPVSQIDGTMHLDHGLMKLDPVSAIVATGRFDAKFTLDARPAVVVTDYDMRLHPTPMGKLLARFGVDESGTTGTLGARIAMRGLGNSVRESLANSNGRMVFIIPAGTMWARNIQLSELDLGVFIQKMFQKQLKEPVQINCGLLGFTVKNGIASADPVLIDTKKNVTTGRGSFSFRDESIHMAVRADAKTFSLFSLQSPVGVKGYFAAPGINVISPQLLSRVGVGVGLGIAVNPIAALIAFIDPGDAKAAACGPVLAGAHARAQRTTKGKPRKDIGPLKP